MLKVIINTIIILFFALLFIPIYLVLQINKKWDWLQIKKLYSLWLTK